jgi:hypothetical protein
MKKPWHSFKNGDDYALDDVVARCREYMSSGNVENLKEKRLWIKIIANSGHPRIVYSPQSGRGRGSSPLNARNWKTMDGDSISNIKSLSK